MNDKVRKITQGGVIAVIYAILTLIIPISYGPLQIRVSEALCILPVFTPVAIPGLFVGCVLANIISPAGAVDMIFGSLATLVAASLTYVLRSNKLVALIPPVVINGLVVGGFVLYYMYGVNFTLPGTIGLVAAGEAIACYGLGYPLGRLIEKNYKGILK